MKIYTYHEKLVLQLLKTMKEGTAPWMRPWALSGIPVNAVTGKRYRGINALKLILRSCSCKYFDDPRWCTFKQAQANGWHVKKGAKGTRIEFYEVMKRSKLGEDKYNILRVDDDAIFDEGYDPHRFGDAVLIGNKGKSHARAIDN